MFIVYFILFLFLVVLCLYLFMFISMYLCIFLLLLLLFVPVQLLQFIFLSPTYSKKQMFYFHRLQLGIKSEELAPVSLTQSRGCSYNLITENQTELWNVERKMSWKKGNSVLSKWWHFSFVESFGCDSSERGGSCLH